MLNFAINNEAIQGLAPIPLLTRNLIYKGYDVMAKSIVTTKTLKKQTKKKINTKIGDKYGRLTVIKMIEPHITPKGQGYKRALCKCECGADVEAWLSSLRRGHTLSCGCKKKELFRKLVTKHGLRFHPLYHTWINIKGRCSNHNKPDFKDYGGRGIQVCKEWTDNVAAFIGWAEDSGWQKGLYIDRKNVNGDYEPSNCRFVGAGLNARNKHLLTITNTSGFRGVWRTGKKWTAGIVCNKKRLYLGAFQTKTEAAKAYDNKARELGAGHPLNFGSGG